MRHISRNNHDTRSVNFSAGTGNASGHMACITHICPELLKTRLEVRLKSSRHLLQELLGRAVSSIALPYGDFNPSVINACELAGYENMFTTIPENIDPTLPKLVRGRVRVDPSDGPIEFFLKFNGAYGWAGFLSVVPKIFYLRCSESWAWYPAARIERLASVARR